MLIGLVVIPSDVKTRTKLVVYGMKPLFAELFGMLSVIIGVTWRPISQWTMRNKRSKDNDKALVSYPEHWMILSTLMILTYNIAMCLTHTGWWQCIKSKPPDPGPPPNKGCVRKPQVRMKKQATKQGSVR